MQKCVCALFCLFICFVAVKLSSSSSAEVLRPTSPRLLSTTTTTTKARVIFTSIGAAGGGVRLELRPAGHLADDTLRVDLLLERVVELEAPTPRRQHRQRVLRLLLDGGLRAAAENHVQLLLGELKRPFLGHGDFFRYLRCLKVEEEKEKDSRRMSQKEKRRVWRCNADDDQEIFKNESGKR